MKDVGCAVSLFDLALNLIDLILNGEGSADAGLARVIIVRYWRRLTFRASMRACKFTYWLVTSVEFVATEVVWPTPSTCATNTLNDAWGFQDDRPRGERSLGTRSARRSRAVDKTVVAGHQRGQCVQRGVDMAIATDTPIVPVDSIFSDPMDIDDTPPVDALDDFPVALLDWNPVAVRVFPGAEGTADPWMPLPLAGASRVAVTEGWVSWAAGERRLPPRPLARRHPMSTVRARLVDAPLA